MGGTSLPERRACILYYKGAAREKQPKMRRENMTRTEKVFLAMAAVFFVAALFFLPAKNVARQTESAFTRPGPTPVPAEGTSLVITLRTRIDLNSADAKELTALPGVGPALAEAIVTYREENGPFTAIPELLQVRGFGEATLLALYAAMGEGS